MAQAAVDVFETSAYESGQLPECMAAVIEERSKEVISIIEDGDLFGLLLPIVDLLEGKVIVSTNPITSRVYAVIVFRRISSTRPQLFLDSFLFILRDTRRDCAELKSGVITTMALRTSLLRGCPMAMRVKMLEAWIANTYNQLAVCGHLGEDQVSVIEANMQYVLSAVYLYPEVCDALIQRPRREWSDEFAVAKRVLEKEATGPEEYASILICVAFGILGATPQGLHNVDQKFWAVFSNANALSTARERCAFIKGNEIMPVFAWVMKGAKQPDLYTCQNCGKFAGLIAEKKRTEAQKAFKYCSYCQQVCTALPLFLTGLASLSEHVLQPCLPSCE